MMHKTIAVSFLLAGAAGIASAQSGDAPDPQAFPDAASAPATEPATTGEPVSTELGAIPVQVAEPPKEDEPAAARAGNRLIEEVVVTATKRSENLSEVPISIAAFSGEKLEALGVESAQDLSKVTPGLTFNVSAGYTQIYLRGVGSDAFLPSADATVPVYIDGVVLLAGHGSEDTLGRVSRVEVVKGPQGTLFGRNSTGGAISIITPDPGPDLQTDVQVGFGNRGTFNQQLFVNLPIFEGLGATISGYNQDHDPYAKNTAGETIDSYSRGGRVKLVWQALDDLSVFATGSYSEEATNVGYANQLTRVAPDFAAIIPEDPKLDGKYAQNVIGGASLFSTLFSAGGDWKLPGIELKLIGSTQKQTDTYEAYDYDGSPLPLLSFNSTDEFFKQKTAELQILSTDETPFNQYFSFVGGFYYLNGNGGFPDLNLSVAGSGSTAGGLLGTIPALNGFQNSLNAALSALCVPGVICPAAIPGVTSPVVTAVSGGLLTSRSSSGYFQGTTHLSEIFGWSSRINLITGLRVDRETRGLNANRLAVRSPLDPNVQFVAKTFDVPDLTKTFLPFKVQLQWFPTEGQQIYTTFSRGYTSPTYSTVNFFSAPPPLKASKVDSYEIGTKLALFDGTLSLNSAAFAIQQSNLLTGFAGLTSGGVVEFENVPKARVYGIEGDFVWQPLPDVDQGLAVVGSATYLKGEYTDYPEGRGYDPATGLAFGPPAPIFGVPVSTLPARDFTGNEINHTPKFSYNAGINQSFDLSTDSRVEINVTTNYQSRTFNDAQNSPEYKTPAFQLYDASLSYFYTPWGLQITSFCNNLTDHTYPAGVFLLDTGRFEILNVPRLYGLRVKFTF